MQTVNPNARTQNPSESPESDNEFDYRINKLKNYQDQMEVQLKHLISLSKHNYVLCQNNDVVKSNDTFVCNLQDLADHLTNAGETLQKIHLK